MRLGALTLTVLSLIALSVQLVEPPEHGSADFGWHVVNGQVSGAYPVLPQCDDEAGAIRCIRDTRGAPPKLLPHITQTTSIHPFAGSDG